MSSHVSAFVLAGSLVLAVSSASPAARPQSPAASDRLSAAVVAMGGEARLASLKSLTLESIGHGWALEQSERPDGPWLTIYRQRTETRDYALGRRRVENQQRFWSSPNWSRPAVTVSSGGVAARQFGDRWAAASAIELQDAADSLALSPERVLLSARAAADLRTAPDEVHQGVNQHVLAFTFGGRRCRLFLNAWTHLPTMLEVVRDDQFGIWGDVTERRWFGYWTLEAGALMYPRQTSVEWNGRTHTDDTVQTITVDVPVADASFAIPDDVRAAFEAARSAPAGMASLKLDASRAVPIADWLVQMPGGFNVAFVRQPDGIVVIEATTTSGYSQMVVAAAEARFPGVPIKAVVTTSDAWPHIGGVREYVARGTPIVALDLNVPILERMIGAPHTFSPDALSRAPRKATLRPVSRRTTLGSGPTRMELIPVRGESGERMMLIWFPEIHTLYSSDLIQRGRPGSTEFFMPAMLMEVETAARREGLTGITQVFGMHLPPTPWAEVAAAITAAK